MRIILPLDGSPLAERALASATQILQQADPPNELILVRTIPIPLLIEGGMGMPTAPQLYMDEAVQASHDYLRAIADRLTSENLTITCRAFSGDPATAICDEALQRKADLIMLTSHGRTGIQRAMLGSVAEAVARQAQVPTLIVRAAGDILPDSGRFAPFMILVALDGSTLAETVIPPAMTLAKTLHGAILLVRVLPIEEEGDRVLAKSSFDYLLAQHDKIEKAGITAHRELAWGDPAEQIAQIAQTRHTDLVALATHGRQGLDRLLHGSVTTKVLRLTELPVLVLHPHPAIDE